MHIDLRNQNLRNLVKSFAQTVNCGNQCKLVERAKDDGESEWTLLKNHLEESESESGSYTSGVSERSGQTSAAYSKVEDTNTGATTMVQKRPLPTVPPPPTEPPPSGGYVVSRLASASSSAWSSGHGTPQSLPPPPGI